MASSQSQAIGSCSTILYPRTLANKQLLLAEATWVSRAARALATLVRSRIAKSLDRVFLLADDHGAN